MKPIIYSFLFAVVVTVILWAPTLLQAQSSSVTIQVIESTGNYELVKVKNQCFFVAKGGGVTQAGLHLCN